MQRKSSYQWYLEGLKNIINKENTQNTENSLDFEKNMSIILIHNRRSDNDPTKGRHNLPPISYCVFISYLFYHDRSSIAVACCLQ